MGDTYDQNEEVQRDQRSYGRSQLGVSTRSRHAKPRAAAPKKPQGHEAFLKMLETSETPITIVTMAGEDFTGTVRHSDHYTISLLLADGSTTVFYKHAIESFTPLNTDGVSQVKTGLTD